MTDNRIESLLSSTGEPMFVKSRLPSLQRLELRGNQLLTTQGLEKMDHLVELYLAANMIKRLDGIDQLFCLTRLHLRDNQITNLDGFSQKMVLLEYINLRLQDYF
ncbi:unnamed protein product [Protopolystoma xenopodis]|uniref:Uncharacterized protein n=1 Tax=Protopolystoma xenopodis TaxID=117903 RepID=A0A3S5CKV9_9PLAT|nr:unnamed protein product [Protopolystoma xenopodis]